MLRAAHSQLSVRRRLRPQPVDGSIGNGTGNFQRLEGHTGAVNAIVAMESDGLFATVSSDLSIRVWDAAQGVLVGHCNLTY